MTATAVYGKDIYENLVGSQDYLINISMQFHKAPCFLWGDIALLVTLYNLDVKILGFFSSWIIAKSKKIILTFWDTFCSQILA